jgi:hypothetical protein
VDDYQFRYITKLKKKRKEKKALVKRFHEILQKNQTCNNTREQSSKCGCFVVSGWQRKPTNE